MAETIPVIHRDRTFEFRGRRYRVSQGSDQGTPEWDGYTIVAVLTDFGDEADIEDALHSMAAVRGYLARAVREGWPYLPDVDGRNPFAPEQEWILAPASR